ncbi:unnamed protein product [Dicrocoelium dendriticum]|nr:unnamed protein product [Dicrocoelium dendriticum]
MKAPVSLFIGWIQTNILLFCMMSIAAPRWIDTQHFSRRALRNTDRVQPIGVKQAMDLLYLYGYFQKETTNKNPLNPANSPAHHLLEDNSGMLLPPPEYHEALRRFQRTYRLPVTGRLDRPTADLLSSPRCGNPDVVVSTHDQTSNRSINIQIARRRRLHSVDRELYRSKRFLIGDEGMKWSKKKLTWQIRSYPTKALTMARTHVVFQYTFNLWSKVTDLVFSEEKDYYKPADIIIQFGAGKHGDSIPFDGPGGVLAHAYYPTPDNVYSFSGDAHFDDDEVWNDGPHKDYRNLISVAAHEMGHSLGLGHSTVPTAIMFPYYLSTWKKVELDRDDISGAQKIYGAPRPGKVIPPAPELPDIPPPPRVTTPAPDRGKVFNYCNIEVDAIIKIRNLELYIFKGPWQWRVTWSKTVTTWVSYQFRDGPAKITYYWPTLPKTVDHVDAGLERFDNAIYMFSGRRFWLLIDNMNLKPGVPTEGLPLTELGLPETVERIDTMFLWGESKAIYLFIGDKYWKLDDRAGPFGRVAPEPDYPRNIVDTWQGVPVPSRPAFTGLNGETLFFSGTNYYVFDNVAMRVRPGYPKPATLGILGCLRNE